MLTPAVGKIIVPLPVVAKFKLLPKEVGPRDLNRRWWW